MSDIVPFSKFCVCVLYEILHMTIALVEEWPG